MRTRPAVLLDVDGTLVDSNHLHVLAWQRAFRRHGQTVGSAQISALIGMGADQMLQRIGDGPNDELQDAWRDEFRLLRDEVKPTPGARNLVRVVHELGATVVYGTSGSADDVLVLREVIDADQWVDEVVTSAEVAASKPAPDIFELALERAGVPASEALVVGDTVWDIEAATHTGTGCVALTCGGVSACDLLHAGALAAYTTPGHLRAELRSSPLAPLLDAASPR